MLFNSLEFLIFFPIVTLGYFFLPRGAQWAWLLAASCVFYLAYVPKYILVLFFLILVDYSAGILIERAVGPRRKAILTLSILANLGMLVVFKYLNFFTVNLVALCQLLHWNLGLHTLSFLLPIGLSFHTFQSMSYTIEVYYRHQKAERNLGIYALYVMFYPQLVAGPIERPQNMIPQFHLAHEFDYDRFWDGLSLMLVGLFKKVVIADRLAMLVNEVYAHPRNYTGFPLITAVFFFAIQVYCDFSGYTDIARGAARVMGFKMMENFRRPYMSKSIDEFWRRWHMSLMSWFNDYVYLPFVMSRSGPRGKRSVGRIYLGIMLVFLLSGLWHGADWKYIVFGLIHGSLLVFLFSTAKRRMKFAQTLRLTRVQSLWTCIQVALTFTIVSLSLVLFRARSVSDAFYVMTHLFQPMPGSGWEAYKLSIDQLDFGLSLALIMTIMVAQIYQEFWHKKGIVIAEMRPVARWCVQYVLLMSVLFLRPFAPQQFIYFQF